MIDLGEAFFRLNEDQAIHAVGDLLGDHRGGAMIDVEAGLHRFKFEPTAFARRRIGRFRAAAGPGHGMKIDIVHHHAVIGVLE